MVACIVVATGAGIMVACIFHIGEVRNVVSLTLEPDRGWLLRRVRLHKALMILFLLAYAVVILGLFAGFKAMNELIVAAVFFLGAAFIYIGILMQNRMAAAMLQTIRGLIPICAWCKRIRSDAPGARGGPVWQSVETYFARRAPVDFTHGICPDCVKKTKGLTSRIPPRGLGFSRATKALRGGWAGRKSRRS
jgi:hypothetical protein